MQTYLVISDGANEIRIPVNARVEAPVVTPEATPEIETEAPNRVTAPIRQRRASKYPPGTKENAVRLVLGGARPIDVLRVFKLNDSTLYNWVWQARQMAA